MPADQLMGEAYCRNCKELLPEKAWYCPACGQKNTDGKISIKEFLHEIADALFNIDSKIFRTLRLLFVPGKLTNEYFVGRRKTYAHPFRLFFFLGIVFFTLLSILTSRYSDNDLARASETLYKEDAYQLRAFQQVDTLAQRMVNDFKDPILAKSVFDSLKIKMDRIAPEKDSIGFGYVSLNEGMGLQQNNIKMSKIDLLEFNGEELMSKYGITDPFEKFTLLQVLRVTAHLDEFVPQLIQQFIWTFLMMLIILGFILKLIYIRGKRYYVEHLIFSFHFHAFTFVLMILGCIAFFVAPSFAENNLPKILGGIFIIGTIYFFLAMKYVYKQGWIKTFFKFGFLNFSYLFLFIFSSVLASFAAAAMF